LEELLEEVLGKGSVSSLAYHLEIQRAWGCLMASLLED
jgi:hypothetical protein